MARGKIQTMDNEIVPAAPKMLGKMSDFDKVLLHLQGKSGNTELTKALKDYLNRLSQTADWLRDFGSMYKVRQMLKSKYGVSDRTAISYCQEAQLAFGGTALHNQSFHIDILLADVMKDIQLARSKRDFRALGRLHQLRKDIIKDFFGGSEAEYYRRLNENQPMVILGFYPEQVQQDDVPTDAKELERKLKKYKSSRRKAVYDDYAEDVEIEMPEEHGFD